MFTNPYFLFLSWPVPWNYPFHNVFNPLVAAVFAGNAIVIKTSEYASWSTRFFGRMIKV